jgi:DNA repair photolyase
MSERKLPVIAGRGSQLAPLGRFAKLEFERDPDSLEEELAELPTKVATEYFIDDAQSIISENDSPDIPFRYSLNPYRGCEHGCSYCYARPTHEYLDLNAGIDFETRVFVKQRAPQLFRDWLCRKGYRPETVMFSGVTDCYQPVERHLRLTRQCIEVATEARQPLAIVTKNALVTRDLDLLEPMARQRLAKVAISLTSLDQKLTRVMEPRTSSPAARLRTIQELTQAGVPVHVMLAPLIPGLTDHEIPALLKAAAEAGARTASYILLRLPMTVEPVFLEWLERTQPQHRDRVESRIRSTRGGELYQSKFVERMRGTGEIAEQIRRTFHVFAKKLGLDQTRGAELDISQFRPPTPSSGQKWLFD